jgi:hypothetical protein
MLDIIIDTILDVLKILPFLYLSFLIIEVIEHKFSNKSEKIIKKSGKFGPFLGGLLGIIPQCGFSVLATNLYVTRILSIGTLISIYLTTSDEMLPILISHNVELALILKILGTKLIIGIFFGFIIDFIFRKYNNKKEDYHICDDENCNCDKENIWISSLTHTIKILVFIFIINFVLNIIINYYGNDVLTKLFLKDTMYSPFLSSLVGLIPNCGASVLLTELYLGGAISFASMIAGLLTGSGVAILFLFRYNKNIKENILILSLIYIIGSFSGLIIEIIKLLI